MSYINVRGHQVWSVIHENNGEPVLLMHGGLSSTEDWDFTVLPAIASDLPHVLEENHVCVTCADWHGAKGAQPPNWQVCHVAVRIP